MIVNFSNHSLLFDVDTTKLKHVESSQPITCRCTFYYDSSNDDDRVHVSSYVRDIEVSITLAGHAHDCTYICQFEVNYGRRIMDFLSRILIQTQH